MSDENRIELDKASPGQGNTVRLTSAFALEHCRELKTGRVVVYRVTGKKPDGKLDAVTVPLDELCSFSPEDFERDYFLITKAAFESLPAVRPDPLAQQVATYAALAPEERTQALRSVRNTLQKIRDTEAHPMAKAKAIMDAVEQSFAINKASLKLRKQDVTVHEHEVASETRMVVNAALAMVESSETTASLFEAFKGLSNGQTLNHVSRVFAMTTSFFHYYNNRVQQRLAQQLRLVFPSVYVEPYRRILPDLPDHLFTSDNLIPLPSIAPPVMKEWALGAFLHDIGKIANLDYFESDAAYNAEQIRQHVFLSAGLILMNYGTDHEEARLIAADHHNALFKEGGYGVTRLEREKGMRKLDPLERCIGRTSRDYLSGQALGFLPTEMLAIIDIYDAMTDASREYKKPLTPSETLVFMRDRPLASGRLDPVLFDLFADFIRVQNPGIPADFGFDRYTR